jgi:pyridinium-3,5-bisthiocarboxylic acid mononucleotide nickel chelatase
MHVHIDPFSGVSGDMLLGALVDAGVSLEGLRGPLATLVDGVELVRRDRRDPRIGGTKVDVVVEAGPKPHRHLSDIAKLIDAAALPEPVRSSAHAAFRRLAEAEAKVHGTTPEAVHFHEVGAVDAIVDVVGVLLGFHLLGATSISCGPVPLGSGFVRCDHGLIPVPVPATVELLAGVSTFGAAGPAPTGELVTPTGATLLRTLTTHFGPAPPMRLDRVAYGLGTRDRGDIPNAVRLILGERSDAVPEATTIEVLTTTVDDLDARLFGPLTERLLADGALDVVGRSVHGKKGRPALEIVVLVPPDPATVAAVERRLFDETTTLGIRRRRERRTVLARRFRTVRTPYGPIRIKEGLRGDHVVTAQPEFEDCRAAATEHDVPVRTVLEAAQALARSPRDLE